MAPIHRSWWSGLAVASLAMLISLPRPVHAQTACRAGPLSAYLQTAGMGCTVGRTRLMQFATSGVAAQSDQVWLQPFTLQGPPGYTWVGFTVRFSSASTFASSAAPGFSFWTDGAPLFGVMGVNNLTAPGANALVERGTRVTLTGDGGGYQVIDKSELLRTGTLFRQLRSCGWSASTARACQVGDSLSGNTLLADGDLRYSVAMQSIINGAAGGQPLDYTMAVLTTDAAAIVTPEPATLILLATGLGGIGALVRRRRRRAEG